MKRIYVIILVLWMSIPATYAVPAQRGVYQTITLSDGTQLRAELRGDEFMAYWLGEDGGAYVMNETTGLYEASDLERMALKADARRSAEQKPVMKARRRVTLGEPVTEFQGEKRGLIILVQFADLSFASGHDAALYNRMANEEGYTDGNGGIGSVRDYFMAQSYGQFTIDFDVAGPVTLPNNYAYYGRDTDGATVNPTGMAELIETATAAVDDDIDFSDYDWSGDGEADLVFFVYAGEGQNNGASSNTIWPHMSTYSSMSGGGTLTRDGVTVDTYACSCEVGKYNDIDGIGTICHEFSHCFGLPDVYDVAGTYNNYGVGTWDVLSYGNYNGRQYGDATIPAGYTSYERWFCGWMAPTVLDEDRTVENMQPLTDTGEAYIIYNDGMRSEYYLLENREQSGWDAGTAGSGLLVLHVDYTPSAWRNNKVNSGSTELYTIFAANNMKYSDKESGHPYPYGENNSLTNTSSPAAVLNNANADGTYFMNKPVTDIIRNEDGSVSFSFANENEYTPDEDAPGTYVFYESFNHCNGTGGNDGVFSGSQIGGSVLADDADYATWTGSVGTVGAYRCAFSGTGIIAGSMVTPEITTTEDSRLLFRAAPYTGDGTTLNVAVVS
ncbi:MAG: M6 family metalloprotease domain-containing protein, partial [Prevotella sp.]|nr:M6 family metalloprotease domain-containing protein [Prevotella sp.]